jgi:hypothetical protein
MKSRAVLALAALAAAPPVTGDLTATYAAPKGASHPTMTLEAAASGDVRADVGGPGLYMLRHLGRHYLVFTHGAKPIVVDAEKLGEAVSVARAKDDPACAGIDKAEPRLAMVHKGSAQIGDHIEDAWFSRGTDGVLSARPDMVISHDRALAPIATAMAEQFRTTVLMVPGCPRFRESLASILAVLEQGAPLRYAELELVAVAEGRIDPKRFELPAPPLSPREMRDSALLAPVIRRGSQPSN